MKKILIILILISLLIIPLIGFAQDEDEDEPPAAEEGMKILEPGCTTKHDLSDYYGCESVTKNVPTEITSCCIVDKILTIGDWIFTILLVVAVIVFLIAAWGFLTAQGEPEKIKNARNFVIYSMVGIAVAFLSKVFVRVVASIMG